MSRGKLSASLVTIALVATALPLLGAASATAAPERRLSEKSVVLTKSVTGFPISGAPQGRQLKRAVVRVRYLDDGRAVIDASVTLRGNPTDSNAMVNIGVGKKNGAGVCDLTQGASRKLWVNQLEHSEWHYVSADAGYTCAGVQIVASGIEYDRMGGDLGNTYIQPKLAISYPRLIGKGTKQLKLVRGVTQNHGFVVKNTGEYRARNVVLTARGAGVKSVRKKVGTIAPGETKTVRVPVRLASKKKRTTVRFTVTGSGVKATRAVRVRAVKAPAKPAVGTWRSTNKTFTFKVKKGAITNFRGINLRMKCGGYGSYPTYRNVTLSFPRVKVPRHGYVEATKKYRKGNVWYSESLSGRVVGKKLTQGKFTYSTAGNCMVIEHFTARR